ncbi:ribbon-helix-helix domain-containing protein [Pelagibius litoralis]|uniref:Ribbon-helix-helix domain-containing protein n=1 Tax=Pelagibius litoralis TaxID=374515 RepID=A0A967CBY2_9PROT|nr:ribbon-helix-helix domain-containing protein [Pelagibius litoralis]
MRKHSVKLSGHSTSLSLEGIYWDALKEVAGEMRLSMNGLIERIDKDRSGNLSSAVRVFLFTHYRNRTPGRTLDDQTLDETSLPPPQGDGES